jgi:hypothetical protein
MNDEILARTPAGRWGQPEEVAGAAVYLASRASDFVTGDTISSRWRLRYSITRAYAAIIVVKFPSREFALSLIDESAVQKLVDDGQFGSSARLV